MKGKMSFINGGEFDHDGQLILGRGGVGLVLGCDGKLVHGGWVEEVMFLLARKEDGVLGLDELN